jgi:hypothetical protein
MICIILIDEIQLPSRISLAKDPRTASSEDKKSEKSTHDDVSMSVAHIEFFSI